jgi:hypothetical protein
MHGASIDGQGKVERNFAANSLELNSVEIQVSD